MGQKPWIDGTEDVDNRRKYSRSPFSDEISIRQKGRIMEGHGIDLSSGGIGFYTQTEPDRFSSMDIIVLRGAISIPGAMRRASPANGEGYRISVAFDAPQDEIYSVLAK